MDKVRYVPSLQGLQALVEVAESGSFTQAAQTLCLTQSAISRKIQQLEAHFGVTLFARTSRSVRMTVEGEQVLASARGILEQLKLLEDRLSPQKRPFRIRMQVQDVGITVAGRFDYLGGHRFNRQGYVRVLQVEVTEFGQ